MPFFDLDNLLRAAQALMQGQNIYAYPDVYYPLPLYLLFVPLASLPREAAHVMWTAIEALIFVGILRRRAALAVLFMPVLLTFLMGQVVMPMLGLFALLRSGKRGGIALALLLLKPQLVALLVPWMLWKWWKHDRRQISVLVLTLSILAIAGFAVQPDWVAQWLAVGGQRLRAPISPSIWGALSFLPAYLWVASAGVCTATLAMWAWRKSDLDVIAVVGFLVNPVAISYDLTLLAVMIRDSRTWIILILLSWASFLLNALFLSEASTVLVIGFVLLVLLKGTIPMSAAKLKGGIWNPS